MSTTTATKATKLDVPALTAPMQALHDSCANYAYEWRVAQLQQLRTLLLDHWDALAEALFQDLHKCGVEARAMELIMIRTDLDHALKHVKQWMKPQPIATSLTNCPAFSRLEPRPLRGPAVLIVGPSNYPVSLCLHPAVGALAAGNPVVLKPSELTPHCAQLLNKLVPQYFDASAVQCVTGGVEETTALLKEPWGRIFFTGSARVGTVVAKAAAQTLTPVTLELGGKSPVYIDGATRPRNLALAIDRIVWSKTVNAGQTCAAADTLIVDETMVAQVIPLIRSSLRRQYGEDPQLSELGRIVSTKHAQRLVDLILEVEESMDDKITKVIAGGSRCCDVARCYVAPTVILNPPKGCRLMREEIFGPILPIVTVQSRAAAIRYMRDDLPGTPLCSYIFTRSEAVFQEINRRVPAGSTMRNDCLMHLASHYLPFGGLGSSGYGRYHGKHTFDTFSHVQPIMFRPCVAGADFGHLRYHPFPKWKRTLLRNCVVGLPGVPNLHLSVLWKGTVLRILGILVWKFAVPAATQAVVWNGIADRVQDVAAWLRPAIVE